MVASFCVGSNRSTVIIYLNFIETPLCAIAAISVIAILYVYIKAHRDGKLMASKRLSYAGFVLSVLSFIFYIVCGLTFATYCFNRTLWVWFSTISVIVYMCQLYVLIAILYSRLSFIFKGTALAISRWTDTFFWGYYIFVIVAGSSSILLWYNFDWSSSGMITAIFSALAIILMIFLVSLFVYKLYKVHRISQQNGAGIQDTIIKTSVLAFNSIFATILTMTVLAITPGFKSIHLNFVREILIIIDAYTNLLCILFSYGYFSSYYRTWCNCCDVCCHSLWSRFFVTNEDIGGRCETVRSESERMDLMN